MKWLTGLTLKQYLMLAAALLIAGVLGWSQLKGKWYAWRASVWKERAEEWSAIAKTQERRAKDADGAAQNASQTRANTDAAVTGTRNATEASAQRLESEQENPPPLGAGTAASAAARRVPADVEFQEGAAAYRAAADRLQRTRAR